jgi:methylmalonyl-CoA/ethylmalonyl-CoA epimerase
VKGRLQHVGVVVDSLAQTRQLLEEVLGLQFARQQSLPDVQMETAFFACGDQDMQIELIEIADPVARGRRLGEGNQGRLDHIAIEVDDIDATRAELSQRGIGWQNDTPSRNGPTRSYFTRPETSRGVVFQILDRRVPA